MRFAEDHGEIRGFLPSKLLARDEALEIEFTRSRFCAGDPRLVLDALLAQRLERGIDVGIGHLRHTGASPSARTRRDGTSDRLRNVPCIRLARAFRDRTGLEALGAADVAFAPSPRRRKVFCTCRSPLWRTWKAVLGSTILIGTLPDEALHLAVRAELLQTRPISPRSARWAPRP